MTVTDTLTGLSGNTELVVKVIDACQKVTRDPKTGRLTYEVKIRRKVDEQSPMLVQAFLDNAVISEIKIAESTRAADGFDHFWVFSGALANVSVSAYSLATDGKEDIEELTFYGAQAPR